MSLIVLIFLLITIWSAIGQTMPKKSIAENGPMQSGAPGTNKGLCKDDVIHCPSWAKHGHCQSNPIMMSRACKLSCTTCQQGCSDRLEACSTMAKANFCITSQRFMTNNCKFSCGLCSNFADFQKPKNFGEELRRVISSPMLKPANSRPKTLPPPPVAPLLPPPSIAVPATKKLRTTIVDPQSSHKQVTEAPVANCSAPLEVYRKQILAQTNAHRALHNAPPLTDDDPELHDHAQMWAEHLARTGRFDHSTTARQKGMGENLAMWTNGCHQTQFDAENLYYDEIQHYGKHGFCKSTGHFTQVVWKASRKFGAGLAKTSDGRVYVVTTYKPSGNFIGEFAENVDMSRTGWKVESRDGSRAEGAVCLNGGSR